MKILLILVFTILLIKCNSSAQSNMHELPSENNVIDQKQSYFQVLKSNGTYHTEDDCMCEFGKMFFEKIDKSQYIIFEYCDTIYHNGNYKIIKQYQNSNSLEIIGRVHKSSKTDTIQINKLNEKPLIYKVHRSNTDINSSGYYYVPLSDSSIYNHYKVNCDENQG